MFGHRFDSGRLHIEPDLMSGFFICDQFEEFFLFQNQQVVLEDFHQVDGSIEAFLVVQSVIEHRFKQVLFLYSS